MTTKRKRRKTLYIILGIVAVVLLVIHLTLAYFVKKAINKQLSQIDPYYGSVEDVDIWLIRGAYTLKDLVIVKKDAEGREEPFVTIPLTDLSIEWKSLFRGRIVGEIELTNPQVNFVFAESYTQTGTETDWVEVVTDLMPIQINRFAIVNGEVKTKFVRNDITMDNEFKKIQLEMRNIRNIVDKEEVLPSSIRMTALSPLYQGEFVFNAKANLLNTVPDMDYDAKFEKIELTALNPLFKYASGMDFESGTLDLYSEMLIQDGQIEGYLKPILTNAVIFKAKEEDRGLIGDIKELLTEGVQEVFENQRLSTTATKMPIQGSVADIQSNFWPTVIGILQNAYWDAITKQIDGSVQYSGQKLARKEAREDRREEKAKEEESQKD
jgi:hypothetical protein